MWQVAHNLEFLFEKQNSQKHLRFEIKNTATENSICAYLFKTKAVIHYTS